MTHSRTPTAHPPLIAGDLRDSGLDPVIAAITHELRTPLQAIVGFGQLAAVDWPSGVDRRYLSHIEQASRLMLRVVDDLLDLSQLEGGTLEIEHDQALDLHAVMLRVLDTADGLRMGKPVRLYANIESDCPRRLRGDGKRIEQILLNLASNAVRFTDRGQVVLGARWLGTHGGQARLRLSVADSGLGMSPDTLDWLRQPMTALPRRHAPQRGGSGFGLKIVRRLLELHGSELRAASVEGGGTLMWFDLTLSCEAPQPQACAPDALVLTRDDRLFQTVRTQWAAQGLLARRAPSPQEAPCAASRWVIDASEPEAPTWLQHARSLGCHAWLVQALPVEPTDNQPPRLALPRLHQVVFEQARSRPCTSDPALQGMRVLVVEDTLLNQLVMRDQLTRIGVVCRVAESARQAQAILAEGDWDAALLDMQLPDMTGLQLARWVRQQDGLSQLPIVFLSAHLSPDDRLAAEVLGAHGCLLKPHDPRALQRLLLQMRPQRPAHRNRTEAGLQAVDSLDLRQLMRSEWPGLRLRLQRAQDLAGMRKAVHAVRGSLAMLGPSAPLQQARTLEEALIAGREPDALTLLAFMTSIEDMLGLSSPNPG